MKTVHVLLLVSLLAAQTLAQVPPPSPNAATNKATAAAINAAPTNLAITSTNLDARRKALLRSITNRAPRLNTNATVLPALPALPSPAVATNIVAAPGTNVNPAANVAAQVAPAAPGNPPASPTPLPTLSNPAGLRQAESAEFSFKFYNTPVDQIFEEYSEITGRTVLRSASLAATPVTIITASPLTRKEAIQALDGALALNNISMIKQGEKFVKAVLATEAPLHGAAISKLQDGEYPDAEQFVTHIVQLKVAKPSELAPLLATFTRIQGGIVPIESNQILVIRDYASNIKRMLELIEQIDVTPESDYKLEVIPIKYGKVTDLYDTMSALVSGGGGGYAGGTRTSAAQQRRAGQLPGAGGAFGTSGRFGAYGSRGGAGFGQPQASTLQPGATQPGATPGGSTFQDRLRQIVNRAAGASEVQLLADARIVPDERSNSLIVYASKQDMQMLTNIVSKVDVLLAQVLIEGVVLSVSLTDETSLGISWLQKPVSFGNNSVGTGGINNGPGFLTNIASIASSLPKGFSYFGALGKNFDVSLNALATSGRVRVLQRPRIQTSHATRADFFTGSSVPFVSGVNYYAYVGSGTQSSQIQTVEVGVTLGVTPYITPDGLVVMEVDQEISSIDKTLTIDGNPVPQTATRHAGATLSVHDNETIMLGGYIEDNRISGKSGVPILKDIPLLGALFRTRNNNKTRSELLLLMHVSILRNPMDSGAQLEAEKARMPGIFEADKEFKETEEQSLKKAGLPPPQR